MSVLNLQSSSLSHLDAGVVMYTNVLSNGYSFDYMNNTEGTGNRVLKAAQDIHSLSQGLMAHTCNPCSWEAKSGGSGVTEQF